MSILRYEQFGKSERMAEELIESILNPTMNESVDNKAVTKILNDFQRDLKFNYGLVFKFGTGIKAMFPVVENLIKNGNLNVETTPENIILLSVAALTIIYLEEKGNREKVDTKMECPDCEGSGYDNEHCEFCEGEGCEQCGDCETCQGNGEITITLSKQDAKTLLEELKLRGIGNGIVKKMIKCFKSIGNLIKVIFKNIPFVASSIIEMFAYTSILVPTMNAISSMIGNYKMDMDTMVMNFLSMGVGITSFLAKSGFDYLINKLRDKFNLRINPDIDVPTVIRHYDIKDGESDMGHNKLIKEQ